jgi:hypothetical protein
MQAPTGEFIDLRWAGQMGRTRLVEDWNVRSFKSFAGHGSCVDSAGACMFTWNRKIDYRPEGPPDVGKMVFLDPEHDLLQEDGVLPGDDYREIWRRIDGNWQNSFGGRCFMPDSSSCPGGFFVVSGMHVGIAVRSSSTFSLDGTCPLKNIFTESERCPTACEQDALDKYFSVIACKGIVICCSRPFWMGKPVVEAIAECIPGCNYPLIRNPPSHPSHSKFLNMSLRALSNRRQRIHCAASIL